MGLPGSEASFFSRSTKISPIRQKKRNKLKMLTLSFFDIIIHLELNLHVISDKLEWSPVSHLRKLLRFPKALYGLVNSNTGGFSFLQVLLETFHEHHGRFGIYCPQGHQHRTSTSCQEGTCDTDHTFALQHSASSTVTAT